MKISKGFEFVWGAGASATLFERGVRLGSALGLMAVSSCGSVENAELFSHSNGALVEHLGEACDLEQVGKLETVVDDEHPDCLPGYCVGDGDEPWTVDNHGICTCRCDGPKGTGPLCSCAEGFTCKDLIKDWGGLGNAHLVGSYCVPR